MASTPQRLTRLPNIAELFRDGHLSPTHVILTTCPAEGCSYIGSLAIHGEDADGIPRELTKSRSALNGAFLYTQLLHFYPDIPVYQDAARRCPNHRS